MLLPANKGGLGITSQKDTTELLRLGKRHRLKSSPHNAMHDLWTETTKQHVVIDSLINNNPADCARATKALKKTHENESLAHVQSLVLQGAIRTAVAEAPI